jgi:hypothetical protein
VSEEERKSHVTLMKCAGDQGFTDQIRFDNAATHRHEAEVVYITKAHWQEIGSPDVVTITVTAADISNHPDIN